MYKLVMVFSLVFLSFNLCANNKRLHKLTQNMDIDDRLRALEDSEFDQYLLQQIKQKAKAKEFAIKSKQIKKERRSAYLENQKNYAVKERAKRKKIAQESYLAKQEYYSSLELRKNERNKYRQKLISLRNQKRKEQVQNEELLANKIYSKLSRLPASILNSNRPRRVKKSNSK